MGRPGKLALMNARNALQIAFGPFALGFGLSLGLLVAIGAQNAFVLRQAIRRRHVLAVVLLCVLADAVLIIVGVAGVARVLGHRPRLSHALALAGGLFLAAYGVRALSHVRRPRGLAAAAGGEDPGRRAVMLQAAAFTLLNPHVYLDTVLLLGNLGARQPAGLRVCFVAGAICASTSWFTLLGFGGRWLAPCFARARAWQVLELLTGATMCLLALRLLAGFMA